MGKFINKDIINNTQSLLDGVHEIIKNPYYEFNSMSPTPVTYYNLNLTQTTTDEVTGLYGSHVSENAPFRYNKIENFIIYGFERINVDMDNSDEGTKANDISGTAYIMPNTIRPYEGDHFTVSYLKEELLFRVIKADPDTLASGANSWKIEYNITSSNHEKIEDDVVEEFKLNISNAGTNFASVILSKDFTIIERIDDILYKLRTFYKDIFYSERVNSVIFYNNGVGIYDSFVTEFLINNQLISDPKNKNDFLLLDHQLQPDNTFRVKYNRSFFRCLETKNKDGLDKIISDGLAYPITKTYSIFYYRPENYMYMDYDALKKMDNRSAYCDLYQYNLFDVNIIAHIKNNELYNNDIMLNMIIKFFNNTPISDQDILDIDNLDIENNYKMFYYTPCLIFCLEHIVKDLMSKDYNN